jgi:sulfur carrier protein
MIEITVNDKKKEFNQNLTVSELLKELGLNSYTVVCEINKNIINKSEYSNHIIQNNDKINIIKFIGGG